MPAGPWQEVSGDFFGPMNDGKYWYVNHCDYSRWASVDMIATTSFNETSSALNNLFAMFEAPLIYETDNGPPFQAFRLAEFAKQWGFRHRKVTPLWPRANGEVESFMKKLGKVLKIATVSGQPKQTELHRFLVAYRATPHSSTQVPPAVLMLNRSVSASIPGLHLSLRDVTNAKA
jgi:hypothetical protein